MSPSEELADGPGGDQSSELQAVSDQTLTTRERYRLLFNEYVVAPARIMWNNPRSRVGGLILLVYLLMGTVGVLLVETTNPNDGAMLFPPFQKAAFPLGTDQTGQNIFALLVHSTPVMLKMVLAGGLVTVVLGVVFGTLAGYKGGAVDTALSVISDIFVTIPGLPVVMVISAIIVPKSPIVVGVLLSINTWAILARQIRSQVLSIRDLSYVEASRTLGLSTGTIISKDVMPNLMPYITVNFVRAGRNVIFGSVALYFLGVLPFTNKNWGVMMNLAYKNGALLAVDLFYTMLFPLIAVVGFTLALMLLAQGADEIFNPRVRIRAAGGETTEEEPDEQADSGVSWS